MDTSLFYLVLVGAIAFCSAFALAASIFVSRQVPVIYERERRSSLWPLVIIAIIGYGALKNGCNVEEPLNKAQNAIKQQNDGDIEQVPAINRKPRTMVYQEPYSQHQPQINISEHPPVWVVLLKKCETEEEINTLQQIFTLRSIESVPMNNGQFWAVIYSNNNLKSEAEHEAKDWKKHFKEYQAHGINPVVIDLYSP